MPSLLKSRFKEADIALPEIQSFYCGTQRWELEVSEWIKSNAGENSVLEDMKLFDTEVWLYRTENQQLVGFGSFGEQNFTWPPGGKKKEKIGYLPYVGVHESYKGKPEDVPRDEQYAYQIIDDILAYAATKNHLFPVVMGVVDQENKRSRKFLCEYRGFVDIKMPRKRGNVVYDRVVLVIEDWAVDVERGWPASRWVSVLGDANERENAKKSLVWLNKASIPALERGCRGTDAIIRGEAALLLQSIDPTNKLAMT